MKFASFDVELTTQDIDGDLLSIESVSDVLRARFDGTAITLKEVKLRRTNGDNPFWTLAYKTAAEPYAHRMRNFKGTYSEARTMGDQFTRNHPELDSWIVVTQEAEMRGYGSEEDNGRIMMDNGQWVYMVDDGNFNV